MKKTNEIVLVRENNYAIIKIHNNLKGNFDCLIDIEDIEKVKNYYWNIRYDKRHPNCTNYVESHKRINKKNTRIHLHRLIMDCPDNMVVDHINGNNLDNRKCNLRIVTQSQNALNRHHKEDCRVSFDNTHKYWVVTLQDKCLGRYITKEKALIRCNYIKQLVKNGEWEKLKNLKCEKLREQNNGLQRNNTTGYKGIYYQKKHNNYAIYIKNKYIMTTKTLEEAILKRKEVLNSMTA